MRFHLCDTLGLAGRKARSKSEQRPALPVIWPNGTALRPRRTPPTAPELFLTSSKQSNRFEAASPRRRAPIRLSVAFRRARQKSLSACSSRFMYPIICKLLSSISWLMLRVVSRSPGCSCCVPCAAPTSWRPRSSRSPGPASFFRRSSGEAGGSWRGRRATDFILTPPNVAAGRAERHRPKSGAGGGVSG